VTPLAEKIVVIDDEKRMCESLTALLEGNGYRVSSFQRSLEAVESIRNEKVDLVITDIKMPDFDGLDILKAVKQIDEGIPVILMTGYASLQTALDAIAQGAYDYLLKPVEFAYLELAVRRAMDKRRSELARLRLLEELKLSNLILERRIGELNALYEAGKSIGSTANLQELLRQIVALAATVTEAQVGSIMLFDERRECLTIEASIGLADDIVENTRLPVGESIAGHVAETGEPIIIADVEHDPRFKRINQERYGSASLLSVPLRIKNTILGVINMANKEGEKAFTQDDLRLLTTFASQAAVAVDDAYQFEKSRRRLIEFEILHEVTNELSSIQSFYQFRALLVKKLSRIFPIDYAIWFNWEPSNKALIPDAAIGEANIPMTESGRIDLAAIDRDTIVIQGADLNAFDLEDIRLISDLVGERLTAFKHYPDPGRAFMAIPIMRNDEFAHLFCFGAKSDRDYTDDDISVAKLVVSQSALLFEREKAILNGTRLLTMGNMISEISHDLRKPLTNISGGVQILRQRVDTDRNSDVFDLMGSEISRMDELVHELIDFSNPNKYETTQVDLRQTIQRAAELVGPDMRRNKVTFSVKFEEATWDLFVNRNQILEMFLNLFINAIDAMPQGGSLQVHGLIERPPHKKHDYLTVRVVDTGVGIKKESLARIFDRYFTTKETGTGLGLSVVERIISAHGGTLRVESIEGKGTTFTVYLPLA
jgi:signal transduction histidine kinase/FixJ family two-component response regulator/putative methionine-R-sulfoxide reductase with GAF domain